MPPKKKKKPKKSVQRTVAESKDAPKRLRGEAITGETMKLHSKIQKGKKKAHSLNPPTRREQSGPAGEAAYTRWYASKMAVDKIKDEAKKLVKGREKTSPSATVGKAGKKMETRRRKKKKDD